MIDSTDSMLDDYYNVPTSGMGKFQSIKTVLAGEITEVVPAGCYVRYENGDATLRPFFPNMTARYMPKVGDFWVVYEPDGYQSISPRDVFLAGYVGVASDPVPNIRPPQ